MESALSKLRNIPPVTRFLTLSLLILTTTTRLNLLSASQLAYEQSLVFSKFELWRLYTSFFLRSPRLAFIFEAIVLYPGIPYKSGDLAWQLFLASAAIIPASYPDSESVIFLRPLLLCIIYLYSMLVPPGTQISYFGLITFPVRYLPYILLALELLADGPWRVAQALPGAIIGHLWWWGVWKTRTLEEMGRAPKWLATWFGDRTGSLTEEGPGSMGTGIQVIPPRSRTQPSSGSWRGTGQRLGGG
ncbi:sor protein [Moniliophthora roreri]|nr:sor protein [Moniliophthora roreri]